MKLNFVLAESALELVPREAWRSPAVVSDARRREADPSRILLDRSVHHSAMGRLRDSERRGRPDLVHEAVLSVTGTPLYLEGSVRLFVHTCENVVLEVEPKTRVPKSYFRFRGLMEKLLAERTGGELVKAYEGTMKELVRRKISPDAVFALSIQGKSMEPEALAREVMAKRNPCAVVGGFPRGHFSRETLSVADEVVRIHAKPLEAHVVAARVVYEVEKAAAGFND